MSAVAAALEARIAPATPDEIIGALAPMVTLFGIPDKSQAEWRQFWTFYVTALGSLPLEAIKGGAATYVNAGDSEFFPKPGPLKALCTKAAEDLLRAVGRARRALSLSAHDALEFGPAA